MRAQGSIQRMAMRDGSDHPLNGRDPLCRVGQVHVHRRNASSIRLDSCTPVNTDIDNVSKALRNDHYRRRALQASRDALRIRSVL